MSAFEDAVIQRIKQLEREVERLQRWEQPVGKWQSYTVSWTAESTNPAIGNGTLIGRYTQIGKTVMGSIYLKCGSTTTYGSGAWFFGLPKTVANNGMYYQGLFAIEDYGTNIYIGNIQIAPNSNFLQYSFYRDAIYNSILSASSPHVWAVNDELRISFTYEVA